MFYEIITSFICIVSTEPDKNSKLHPFDLVDGPSKVDLDFLSYEASFTFKDNDYTENELEKLKREVIRLRYELCCHFPREKPKEYNSACESVTCEGRNEIHEDVAKPTETSVVNTFVNSSDSNFTFANESGYYLNVSDLSDEEYLQQIKEFLYPKTWTWVLIFFHSVVFIIGLVGNTLVCVAVYRNHTMRTVTNYFIVNLAVADFLVIFICLPPSVIWDVMATWFFGTTMCKITLYLQVSSKILVSIQTIFYEKLFSDIRKFQLNFLFCCFFYM